MPAKRQEERRAGRGQEGNWEDNGGKSEFVKDIAHCITKTQL